MKKVALLFVIAVLAPSLVLAWLAVRSLRDQQFLLERQQSLLDQRLTDTAAQNIADYLARQQQDFRVQVESLASGQDPEAFAAHFDDQLRQRWPLAEVGFCVTAAGKLLSPPPNGRPAAQMFRLDNSGFLGNREPVEVYLAANNNRAPGWSNAGVDSSLNSGRNQDLLASVMPKDSLQNSIAPGQANAAAADAPANELVAPRSPVGEQAFAVEGAAAGNPQGSQSIQFRDSGRNGFFVPSGSAAAGKGENAVSSAGRAETLRLDNAGSAARPSAIRQVSPTSAGKAAAAEPPNPNTHVFKAAEPRKVNPQSQVYQPVVASKMEGGKTPDGNNLSRVVAAEADFQELIGDQADGMLARFLQNKLKLMCWHRLKAEPDLIFGAQLNLVRVVEGLRDLIQSEPSWGNDICLAVLDDNARPVVLSHARFQANWKRPFVATEVGDALPHWEVAAYLIDPAQLTQAAHTARLTLGLLIAVLVVAIGIGSLLVVRSLNAELKLARQKTDFVSNVSHELKTPLTSIRMFSELLAEDRVTDPDRRRSYLQIITAEAARLTRLINNVLDFSRMERGEKKYNFQGCDLTEIVRTTAEANRPHLESAGVRFVCVLPAGGIAVRADGDALSQVIVNLLSNAEKYSGLGERRASNPPDAIALGGAAPSPAGGGPAREILVELNEKQTPLPYAEVRVLDRGPGVPRGCEEKIFEKFYRAHDSLSSGIQGSGLGLTIARQIARAHGGDVVYEPREGGGSCFCLRLPVRADRRNEAR